jgi:hypothetical protein
MQISPATRATLASVGCAALLVYVLACNTAFSPDDNQVLYPSLDPASGAACVAVYDRKTSRSEPLFVAGRCDRDGATPIRMAWFPDGRHVLAASPVVGDRVLLTVLPRGVSEPVRSLGTIDLELGSLIYPGRILGRQAFFCCEKRLWRLDLVTGQSTNAANKDAAILLPGGPDDALPAIAGLNTKLEDGLSVLTFGTLDPGTFAFAPALSLTNDFGGNALPCFDPRTRQVVLIRGGETNRELCVERPGVATVRQSLARERTRVWFGLWIDVGPRNDRACVAYLAEEEGAADAEYGVVEVPFGKDRPRWIPLFRAKPEHDHSELMCAQAALSHDGKVWAMATTFLDPTGMKPEDRALFLVEVGSSKAGVTRVPIPRPPSTAADTKAK